MGLEEKVVRVPTAELDSDSIAQIRDGFDFEASIICSVVPPKADLLRSSLSARPVHQVTHRSNLPIGIDYPLPDQIGADRLANAVAVHHQFGAPAIVIDFGTAVTFDVVGGPDQGESAASYLGGVITPGLASMTEYLHRRTALLPQIDLAEPKSAIGKSTTEAMRAGAVYGYRGMIREILQAIQGELHDTPTIVATGGDAALISRGLPEVREVIPNLTLDGIRLIGLRNIA